MDSKTERTPYGSARDLPTVADLLRQIQGLKALTLFVGRKQRRQVLRLERDVNALADQIDAFYALLGPRRWIYHDHMSTEAIVDVIDHPSVDDAEKALIGYYRDEEVLTRHIRGLRRFPQLRARMAMIECARDDYFAERYYSTVLVLIAVMDGFVNDLDTSRRRGLHACDAGEMSAWDSVVGHHLGLTSAHRTFTRSFARTSDEQVHELYRNGIVHGMLVNFDNAVVATKAWNRLFAVADWATSLEREATPPKPEPTWRELFARIGRNAETRRALDEWRPRTLTENDADFETDSLHLLTAEFLDAWTGRNYGAMAAKLASLVRESTVGATAGRVREDFSPVALTEYTITRLDFQAPAICKVDVELTCDGETRPGRLRWFRENEIGDPATPNVEGEWRAMDSTPFSVFHRAQQADDPA